MIHVIGIAREEGAGFRLSFPDFPDLAAEGESLERAVNRAAEELSGRLRAQGGQARRLRGIEALATDEPKVMAEGIAVLVPVAFPPDQAGAPREPLPEEVPPAIGQVPLSGRVAATEEPTDRALAKAEAEIGSAGRPGNAG